MQQEGVDCFAHCPVACADHRCPACRGRNPSTLEGLRKRISSLFLTFCTTPAFNPEAARFQVRPAGVPTAVVAEPEDETFEFTLEDVKGPAATSSGRLGGTTIAAY